MSRLLLSDLPQGTQDAAAREVGGVLGFAPARLGARAHIAGTIRTRSGLVFLKGVATDDVPETKALRAEAAILQDGPPLAPKLLWQVEADGWLLLGLEHITGRKADYRRGSPDLAALAATITALAADPRTAAAPAYAERLYVPRATDTTFLGGPTLLHVDLNPTNLLLTSRGPRLVDWGFAALGAAWVEAAAALPWLMVHGHTPHEAETWAAEHLPGWSDIPRDHLDLYTELLADRWNRGTPHTGLTAVYASAVAGWCSFRRWHVIAPRPAAAPKTGDGGS